MRGDERPEPPLVDDERSTLTGFLDYQRATLEWKCSDLRAEQLARRASPPSSLSLLGIVRHLADVERSWFDRVNSGGARRPSLFSSEDQPDGDFDGARPDDAVVREAFAAWRAAIDESDTVLTSKELDDTFEHPRAGRISVRWVLVHMIEEYARHNGHADFLREAIDGSTGE
jgi:uncharacterized damage-inducible protein DinB